MGRSRTPANTERLRTFMGIATALWLVGAIAALIDGDTLMAVLVGLLCGVRGA